MLKRCIPLLLFAIGMIVVSGTPVSAVESCHYSFIHLSDTQHLSSTYPQTLNYTFSYLNSIKDTYNVSAIVITGDLVDDGSDPGQWKNYLQARSLTTIPLYEIPGNHDLRKATEDPKFEQLFPGKTNWQSSFNDFTFIGIGYSDIALSNSDILHYKSLIEESPQKFTLLAAHNYFNDDFTLSPLGESIFSNLVLKPTFILSGHAHARILYSSTVNGIVYVEDLDDYQDNGDFSAGRMYTVYKTNDEISKITVRDLYIYPDHQMSPEISVYDRKGVNGYPLEAENPLNNYCAPSVPTVPPSSYSPEYFINPSQIIGPPSVKVSGLADGIEDTLEERYIQDLHDDDDQGQFINPSHIISHDYGLIFQISDNIEDRYVHHQDSDNDLGNVINPSLVITPRPAITASGPHLAG